MATELEVSRRTILRDIDALEEAGLPIVVIRGNMGGVELGFNYRSRLVGLDAQEAEAFGALLALPKSPLAELGMKSAAHRACDKLVESLPIAVRQRVLLAQQRFQFAVADAALGDPRVVALVAAIRNCSVVRLNCTSKKPRVIHPVALKLGKTGWAVVDAGDARRPIGMSTWGDINISAHRFVATR